MVKLVDTPDLKSDGFAAIRVRLPFRVPTYNNMTIKLKDSIKLLPRNLKGSNRIREARTDRWLVDVISETVLFDDKKGPWLYIVPSTLDQVKARWVHQTFDKDFIVLEL